MENEELHCPIAARKRTLHAYSKLFRVLVAAREVERNVYCTWTTMPDGLDSFCEAQGYIQILLRSDTGAGMKFTITPVGLALIAEALSLHLHPGTLSDATDWHDSDNVPPVETIIVQTVNAALKVESGWYTVREGSIAAKNVDYLARYGYVVKSNDRFRFTGKGVLAWANATDFADLPSFPALIKQGKTMRGEDYWKTISRPIVPPFTHEAPLMPGDYWYQYKNHPPRMEEVLYGYSDWVDVGVPVESSKCLGHYKSDGEFMPIFQNPDERWAGPIPLPGNTLIKVDSSALAGLKDFTELGGHNDKG